MVLNKLDVVKLTDNCSYVVVSIINYNNSCYAYLIDIKDKKNIIFTEVFEDRVEKINDQNLLNELLPLFYQDSMNSLASFETNE